MKILHVLPSNRISGAENVVADIIMMFKEDIEMSYTSPKGPIIKSLEDREVPYIPLEKFDRKNLRKVIKEYNPDIVHAHDFRASILLSSMGINKPIVSQIHVNSKDLKGVNAKTILYRFFSSRIDKVITVSNSIMEDYIFSNSIKKKNKVIPNILYNPRITKLIQKDSKDYDYDFVYVGRLAYQKNPERVATVASKVLKMIPTAKFGVIGEGDLKENMETIFYNEGVTDQVEFTGNLSYPYKALKQSKCLLMSSRFEGMPITVLEAMSLGVPIVSTPVDGMNDLLPDTDLFSNDDIKLANNIVELINSSEVYVKESLEVSKRFVQINDIEGYKSQLTDIYQSLI